MSCFWTGLIKALKTLRSFTSPDELIDYLQANNHKVYLGLSAQEIDENYESVRYYKKEWINRGYDCSTSDPFLWLICSLFSISIDHHYNEYCIRYTNGSKKIIVHSNNSHFWS
jgi:hypothetical protein